MHVSNVYQKQKNLFTTNTAGPSVCLSKSTFELYFVSTVKVGLFIT